jgi:peptide/nickel transport system substrate-binding protein
MIIPKHLFKDYVGAKSREAPNNLKPVGTGPYMFVDFKPGDMLRAKDQSQLPRRQPAAFR